MVFRSIKKFKPRRAGKHSKLKRSNPKLRWLEERILSSLSPLLIPKPGSKFNPDGKILVTKSCCMGDAVLSLYAIRDFKLAHPSACVDVLVTRRIQSVYMHCPEIHSVYSLPLTGRNIFQEILSPKVWFQALYLFLKLRRYHYDALIDFEVYRRHSPLLRRLLNIPFSSGFHAEDRPVPQHHHPVFRGKKEPEWACFYGLFNRVAPEHPQPLYLRDTLTLEKTTIGIVFTTSFNWPEKQWPLTHFAEIIEKLEKSGYHCLLYGSPDEVDQERSLLQLLENPIDSVVGQLKFLDLVQSLSKCALVLGNDTGTLHVAAASGTPTLALFGPTEPLKWTPIGGKAIYLESLPCRPCYYLGEMPDCSHKNCLQTLSVEKVWDEISKLLPVSVESLPRS
jgi:ADP-heptose:LPS heptosyltransferase